MSKYAILSVSEQAYYSGRSYEENLILPFEIYAEIRDELPEQIYLGELDGKHSYVEGNLEIDIVDEEYFENYEIGLNEDGNRLHNEIVGLMKKKLVSLSSSESIIKETRRYVKAKNQNIKLTIQFNKSKEQEILKLLKEHNIQIL